MVQNSEDTTCVNSRVVATSAVEEQSAELSRGRSKWALVPSHCVLTKLQLSRRTQGYKLDLLAGELGFD